MIYLKTFEGFHDDGIEIDSQTSPDYNPVIRHKAKEYIENIFNSGAGAMVTTLCKEIGIAVPKTDEELEIAQKKAIEYYIKNPERIKDISPPDHKKYPFLTGDGISRTNNIGGVFN